MSLMFCAQIVWKPRNRLEPTVRPTPAAATFKTCRRLTLPLRFSSTALLIARSLAKGNQHDAKYRTLRHFMTAESDRSKRSAEYLPQIPACRMNFIPGFRRVNVYRAVGQDAGSTASLRSRATRASDLSRLIVASPYVGSPYIETGGVCLRSKPRVVPRRPSHGQTLPQIAQQSGGS